MSKSSKPQVNFYYQIRFDIGAESWILITEEWSKVPAEVVGRIVKFTKRGGKKLTKSL